MMGALEPNEGKRGHKLLPKEVQAALPQLYSQEQNPDPMVRVKYFSPYSGWTWYATEGDYVDEDGVPVRETHEPVVDYLFFGLVKGHETELGYFSFNEMAKAMFKSAPAVERDLHFDPVPLSKVREDNPRPKTHHNITYVDRSDKMHTIRNVEDRLVPEMVKVLEGAENYGIMVDGRPAREYPREVLRFHVGDEVITPRGRGKVVGAGLELVTVFSPEFGEVIFNTAKIRKA